MNVQVTPEQQSQIRLLSDGELYRDAVDFVDKSRIVDNKQMAGLLEFSRSWGELNKFVKHQKGRDWHGRNSHYTDFYTKLSKFLDKLRTKIKTDSDFVPNRSTNKETKKYADYFAGLLAREFIQHLVAEMMWKEKGLS